MTLQELSQAKDPDLRASLQALWRAAQQARKTAIQTGTNLVIMENQQIVYLSPHDLQQQGKSA